MKPSRSSRPFPSPAMRLPGLLVLFSLLPLPAFAGQATIVETDDAIIIEYNGSDEDRENSQRQVAERESQLAKEKERAEHRAQSAARRAAARAESEADPADVGSGAADPGAIDPGAADPGAADPGAADPGSAVPAGP